MGDHGRGGSGGGKRSTGGAGVVAPDPADRPGASGHRFGPGLVCSECGVRWDAHQRSPQPCAIDLPSDPFARRPLPPAPAPPAVARRIGPVPAIEPLPVEPGDGEGGER